MKIIILQRKNNFFGVDQCMCGIKKNHKKLLFYLKLNLPNKMPVSLNPVESKLNEPSQHLNTTSVNKRRLKTTNKMVEDALIELHSVKGKIRMWSS